MANADHEARPRPTARLVYSVAGLIVASAGTMLFLSLRPVATAAVEASLGRDPIPFLRGLVDVLLLAWGVLLLKLPLPEADRLRTFRWFIAVALVVGAIVAVELVFVALVDG